MTTGSSSSRTVQIHREKLESNGILATKPCEKDKIYIDKLEMELRNCYQEIDYLQDQLNLRSSQANFMGEHVHSLELKLSELEKLNKSSNFNEIQRFESEYLVMIKELKYKEEELQNSILQVQKLETSYLDSQCEIESLKLELNEMEQRLFESREAISQLEAENKEFELYGGDSRRFFSQVESQLERLLEKLKAHVGIEIDHSFVFELRKEFQFSDSFNNFEEAYDSNAKDEMNKMRNQIQESEILIKQLKEELLEEKRKAKEDSEDLTQEMAELRYRITGMLDEEYKRRALIEETSINRIKQLEELLFKEREKATSAMTRCHEARELAERQYLQIKKLKNALEKLHSEENRCIESCMCGFCTVSEEPLDSITEGHENADSNSTRALIGWYSSSTCRETRTQDNIDNEK